jgi:hypothetical protein
MIRARRAGAAGTANTKGNAHHVGAFDPKGLSGHRCLVEAALQGGELHALLVFEGSDLGLVAHGPPELQRCLQLQQILVGNQGSTQKEILHFSLRQII